LLAPLPNPTLEVQAIRFVWVIIFDLSGMGGPSSS